MTGHHAEKLCRTLFGTLLVLTLVSCGMKGDLYLPEPEKTAAESPGSTTSVDGPVNAGTDTTTTDAEITDSNKAQSEPDDDTERLKKQSSQAPESSATQP